MRGSMSEQLKPLEIVLSSEPLTDVLLLACQLVCWNGGAFLLGLGLVLKSRTKPCRSACLCSELLSIPFPFKVHATLYTRAYIPRSTDLLGYGRELSGVARRPVTIVAVLHPQSISGLLHLLSSSCLLLMIRSKCATQESTYVATL